jgi:putative membrane protein
MAGAGCDREEATGNDGCPGMKSIAEVNRTERVWKGLLAGALAGLVASWAMSQFHSLLAQNAGTSSPESKEDSTVKTASAISRTVLHRELTAQEKKAAGLAVHYSFGSGVAAIYGTAVELAPVTRTGWGLPFGAAVWLGAHVIAVPVVGLSGPVTESTPREEAVEFGAHLLYGAVVEAVRRLLRKHLFS